METFLPFFLIIFAGVFFSMIFKRLHVPWTVALILGGILIGPHALGIFAINPTIDFIAQLGLLFLMFMAGLETSLSSFQGFKKKLFLLAFINGAIPFVAGLSIGFFLGYGWLPALLIATIFVSSSIAAVIPTLESQDLLHTRLGQSVVMTTVIQDVASLILLSIIFQSVQPVTNLPLYVFYPMLLVILFVFRLLLPKIRFIFSNAMKNGRDLFQSEFRYIFLILLGTVIVFEVMGLHPIIAAFFSGLVLSDSIRSAILRDKIRTISYSIFIPTFFIIIGAQTDIGIFFREDVQEVAFVVALVVAGSIVSKFASGFLGARFVGFDSRESLLFAVSSIPQLSTTLAVAFSAFSFGYIDQTLVTAMIVLSVITVLISPTLLSVFGKRIRQTATASKREIPETEQEAEDDSPGAVIQR